MSLKFSRLSILRHAPPQANAPKVNYPLTTTHTVIGRQLCQARPFSGSKWPYWHEVRTSSSHNQYLKVSEEVRAAVYARQPVVALETAIYTHGFPYPENVALASHLESVVRVNGGIPATVGVLNGVGRVGLQPEELIELAASAGKPETKKVSRRDLSYICGLGATGRKFNGGTTISGTMVLAALAGIKIFATGGLGGVHRGGELSLDISADLTELGRTQMAVFSSGCKSFLDLPRTLEYLETQGVPVGTFADGRSGEVDFPAFWTRESKIKSPMTIKDETEAASMIDAMTAIPTESGILFANPISPEHSIEKTEMDAIISQAIQDADDAKSIGFANTPFVLNRIREISDGRSVIANRALIESNVTRATKAAVIHSALVSKIRKERYTSKGAANREKTEALRQSTGATHQFFSELENGVQAAEERPCVMVAGSVAIDLSCDFAPRDDSNTQMEPLFQTSNPSSTKQTIGGVGYNVASAIHHLGSQVILCSKVGSDLAGRTILESLARQGLPTNAIRTIEHGSRTAQYMAINDTRKALVLAMADMEIMETREEDFEKSWQHQLDTYRPRWLAIDTNWDSSTFHEWLRAGKASGARIAVEPVSIAKAKKIFDRMFASDKSIGIVPKNKITLATPNAQELRAMHEAASSSGFLEREDWFEVVDSFGLSSSGSRAKLVTMTSTKLVDQGVPQQSLQLLPFIPCILTTLGDEGVLMTELLRPGDDRLSSPYSAPYILSRSTSMKPFIGGIYMRLFPPVEKVLSEEIVSVNGAGDTFLGVIIAGLAKENPKELTELINVAQKASILTLKSAKAVSPAIERLKDAL